MRSHSKLTRLLAIGLTATAVAPASASAMKDVSGVPANVHRSVDRVAPQRPHVLHRRGPLTATARPFARPAPSVGIASNGGGADGPLIAAFAAMVLAAGAGGVVSGRRSQRQHA
jgi:hypothetical protein